MLFEPHQSEIAGHDRFRRIVTILLRLAVFTGLAVSIASVIEEFCMATACSDAASFVFFGIGMGVLGCIYFCFVLALLFLREKSALFGWMFTAMVFSGVGAEFRLLWIQKYIIGSWCPFCVTICCTLLFSAVLLFVETVRGLKEAEGKARILTRWLAFVTAMIVMGLAVAVAGVHALT